MARGYPVATWGLELGTIGHVERGEWTVLCSGPCCARWLGVRHGHGGMGGRRDPQSMRHSCCCPQAQQLGHTWPQAALDKHGRWDDAPGHGFPVRNQVGEVVLVEVRGLDALVLAVLPGASCHLTKASHARLSHAGADVHAALPIIVLCRVPGRGPGWGSSSAGRVPRGPARGPKPGLRF